MAALLLAGLTACANATAPTPVTTHSAELPSRIGAPQLIRAEGEVEYRRYRVGHCQVDLFLTDAPGSAPTIEWLDARPAREADPTLGSTCAGLATRLRGKSFGELL
ncbi:MAG: hypothetical protein U1E52_16150 [Geminicoccaceae bacterium]